MEKSELDHFVKEFLRVWNSHDVEQIIGLMTEDCVFEPSSRAWGTHYEGIDAVAKAVVGLFKTAPDIHWEPVRYFAADDKVVVEVLATGTDGNGNRFETAGCDVLTLRDGKIAAKRAYRKL